MKLKSLFFIVSLSAAVLNAPAAMSGKPCPALMGQVAGVSESGSIAKSGSSFYSVTDRKQEDFHVTGVLNTEGTLKIGMYVGNTRDGRSELNTNTAVREIMNHFEKKIKRIELKLSKDGFVDDNVRTVEPELDAFNKAWLRAVSDPELIKKERILGNTSLWNSRDTFLKRSVLATRVGTAIAFSMGGFYDMKLQNSLGKEGSFIAVEIIFLKANPKE